MAGEVLCDVMMRPPVHREVRFPVLARHDRRAWLIRSTARRIAAAWAGAKSA
jgi:hypothetical protein